MLWRTGPELYQRPQLVAWHLQCLILQRTMIGVVAKCKHRSHFRTRRFVVAVEARFTNSCSNIANLTRSMHEQSSTGHLRHICSAIQPGLQRGGLPCESPAAVAAAAAQAVDQRLSQQQ
jgi:hypothetical protein